MIVVSGTLRTTPQALARLGEAMRAVIETTRGEEGCRVYAFSADVIEPGLIRIYEEWDNREALAAHSRAPHIAEWHEALEAAGGAAVSLSLIEVGSVEAFA